MSRALILLLVAACVSACGLVSPEDTSYARDPALLPPAPAPDGPRLRVLLAGDLGEETFQRSVVVAAMSAVHRHAPFDLAVILGDNLHHCGPDVTVPGAAACRFAADGNTVAPGFAAPSDRRFAVAHDDPLAFLAASAGKPAIVHPTLGNHDVETGDDCTVEGLAPVAVSRTRACLEVAHRTPTWSMPARHYALDAGPARFIVIDGNLLKGDYGGFSFADEVAFVRESAAPCVERFCFIVSHFPPAAAGPRFRREGPDFFERVAAIEAAAGGRIRAWLSGHHHDLMHLRSAAGYDVFISGNTALGRRRPMEGVYPEAARLQFFSDRWGFATLELGAGGWGVRFEDSRGRALHCCEARGTGACEPVRCATPGEAVRGR